MVQIVAGLFVALLGARSWFDSQSKGALNGVHDLPSLPHQLPLPTPSFVTLPSAPPHPQGMLLHIASN